MVKGQKESRPLKSRLRELFESYKAGRVAASLQPRLIIPESQGPANVSAERAFNAELNKFAPTEKQPLIIPESQACIDVSARRAFDSEMDKCVNMEANLEEKKVPDSLNEEDISSGSRETVDTSSSDSDSESEIPSATTPIRSNFKEKSSVGADPDYIPSVSTPTTKNNLECELSESSLHYPIPYNSDTKTTSSSSSGEDGNNSVPAVGLSEESDGDDFEIPLTDIKHLVNISHVH